ncbi:MAG: OmpA family protein [Deltaproteobacteria bacterium]
MTNKFLLGFLMFFYAALNLSSQTPGMIPKGSSDEKLFNKAVTSFNKKDFEKAKKYFNKIVRSSPGYIKPYLYLASISYDQSDFISSENYYRKALLIDSMFMPDIYYSLAVVLEKQEKISEAIRNYDKYISIAPDNPGMLRKSRTASDNLKRRLRLVENPVSFRPVSIGNEINTPESEYFPGLTGDNRKMIFTRRVRGQEDFFEAEYKNGHWTDVKPISEINSPWNEGANTITVDGNTMIFSICEDRKGLGSCDLYISKKKDGKWAEIKNMGTVVNSEFWDSHPSLSHDGRTLYFVSDRPGGYGKKDIWISRLSDNGNWLKPECLDTNINTRYDDFTPFIHADNATLYFTSTGHEGMGSSDLFLTKKINGHWTKAVNLGYPVNTPDHEGGIFITLDGKTAFFCTDRFQSKNKNLDIYSFEVPDQIKPGSVSFVKGIVYDSETRELLESDINIYDNNSSNLLNTVISSKDSFLVALPGGIDYNFTVKKKGYAFHSERFLLPENMPEFKPYYINIGLRKLNSITEDSKPIVLNNVFFDFDSSQIDTVRSASELNNLLYLLKENPELKIRINGHTDNQGTEAYNLDLSAKRAKAVYDYLINMNVNSNRLTYKGFGESMPVTSNDDEAGRQKNRRTEFEIIK